MTPKEKAKEIIGVYYQILDYYVIDKDLMQAAKECALNEVDEILKSFDGFMDARRNFRHELEIDAERYWLKVKEEIIKL